MQHFRAFRYGCVVIAGILCNFLVLEVMLALGGSIYLSNIIAFFAGGQLSFLLHDIHTYGDKHPTMAGWRKRWVLFVGGNFSSMGINSLAMAVLLAFQLPDRVAHVSALATSGLFSILWNHFVSHKDSPESNTDPVSEDRH